MGLQCNEAGRTRLTVEISNFVGYCTELSRSINNEKQQQYQMEIEQLRKEKEELELQLEICRIERDDLAKKNQQSDAPQTVLETRAVQEQILEEDRTFASQLLAEIWRGTRRSVYTHCRNVGLRKWSGRINRRVGSMKRRFSVDRESSSLRLYLKLQFREHTSISVVTICHDHNSVKTHHTLSTSCLSFESHPHSQWRFDPRSPSSNRISFSPS